VVAGGRASLKDWLVVELERIAVRLHDSGPSLVSEPLWATARDSHLMRVFAACDGNVSLAAVLLGISRRTFQRMMTRLLAARC
jgi:ActR/RegA family two-component response regulator